MLGLGNLIIKSGLVKTIMWDHNGSGNITTGSEVAGHNLSGTSVSPNEITTVSRTHTAPSDYSGTLRNLVLLRWVKFGDYAAAGATLFIKDVEVTVTRGASVVKSFTSDFTGGAGDNSDELINTSGVMTGLVIGAIELETNSTLDVDSTSGWLKITFIESQGSKIVTGVGDALFVPEPGTAGDVVQIDYKIYYVDPYVY